MSASKTATAPLTEDGYDEILKPYAAAAELALDCFFSSGEREDAARFFLFLDGMMESVRQGELVEQLKGLTVGEILGAKKNG